MFRIAHAAALTDEDRVPFTHGVALAHTSGAELFAVHANRADDAAERMLDAGTILVHWGDDAARVPFEKMVHQCCDDPVDTVLDALRKLKADLVVAATHQRHGIMRALLGSKAEAIAHNVEVPTLLVPVGIDGFVANDSGTIDLHRVLIPIGDPEAAQAAVDAAATLGRMAGAKSVEFVLLHVGDPADTPEVNVPVVAGWTVSSINVTRVKLEDAVISRAADSCLVVMATRGHDSVGDVLLGSHTDRVLHRVTCPVLSVPVPRPAS
ncbi:MAG: hypothetical protein DRJ42_10340 [Deltaproteobacteria bacterium]|nr:MAG: hypothetical protein DRJ42_10340 [Deltaproteobacteria bacterium]